MNDYTGFIASKAAAVDCSPVEHGPMADHLYPFQADLVGWALARGRAAMFADTGLGKTAMQIEWARHVAAHGRVLILAPLAVTHQTVKEAERFGVEITYARKDDGHRITVANYEMLEHFDPAEFVGVVLDESSILKSYDGATRNAIIRAFATTQWRLACTATPAPNDFTELGNHSEFLGIKSRVEMLAEYFVHDGGDTSEWRLKGHAQAAFWNWVCSWGAMVKRPSDLGYEDGAFALPPLRLHEHVVRVDHVAELTGTLFAPQALSLSDQRAVRRGTISGRVAAAARLASGDGPVLVWAELNAESDAATEAIPGAVQVSGSDSIEEKVDRLLGFSSGKYRVLVTKPSIAGFGMNWQHCATMIFLGASHSYEQTYQAIRRCWRFGQDRPVDVHVIRSDADGAIVQNYRRKEADAERLAAQLAAASRAGLMAAIRGTAREWNSYDPQIEISIPNWLEVA